MNYRAFIIRLQPVPMGRDGRGADSVIRLRQALKVLLRSFGLRATRVRAVREREASAAADRQRESGVG